MTKFVELSDAVVKVCNSAVGDADTCSVVSIEGRKAFLARQSCPAVLNAFNKDGPSLRWIVVVQPYSEGVRQRLLSANNDPNSNRGSSEKSAIESGLDITGSPLQLEFGDESCNDACSLFLTTSEKPLASSLKCTSFRGSGFDIMIARSIWTCLMKIITSVGCKLKLLPVYILTNGSDIKGTILFGLKPLNHSADGSVPSVLCSRSHVYCRGPVNESQLPTLDDLRVLCTGPATAAYVESSALSTYESKVDSVLEQADQVSKRTLLFDSWQPSLLAVTCRWSRPSFLLCSPAPDSSASLEIHVPPGDGLGLLSRELLLLKRAVTGLHTKEVLWLTRVTGQPSATDNLNTLIDRYQTGEIRRQEAGRVRDVCGFDDVLSGKTSASALDFLDSLWQALLGSESLQELQSCLRQVFYAVSTSTIRPQIHIRDTSQVAVICRGLMRGQMKEPELSGLQPLEMLVELGIASLRKKLTSILLVSELATSDEMAPFLCSGSGPDGRENAFSRPEDSVLGLLALQVALHVAACLRNSLGLQPATLASYTSQVLRQLQEDTSDVTFRSHVFKFPVEMAALKGMLQSVSPSTWQVMLSTSDPAQRESSYRSELQVTVSKMPLLKLAPSEAAPFSYELSDLSLLETESGKGPYHCTFVATVTDAMFH